MDRHQADAAEQAVRRADVDDRRVLDGIFCVLRSDEPARPARELWALDSQQDSEPSD
jgi:hypothetical protein